MTWSVATRDRILELQTQLISVSQWADKSSATEEMRTMLLEPYREMLEAVYTRDLPLARLADESDLLLHVKGPAVSAPMPRVSVVAKILTSTRDEIARLARQIGGVTTLRLPVDLEMTLVGLAEGSLFVGLAVDSKPASASARDAVRIIGTVSALVTERATIASIALVIDDPAVRDIAVGVVRQMAPSGQMGITEVDLFGKAVPRRIELTTDTRRSARRLMAERPAQAPVPKVTFVGTVREIDLDAKRFEIRNVEGYPSGIRCAHELDDDDIKALVDLRVRVEGTAEYVKQDVRLLWVDQVEIVG
jgi:hypothetical protein